MGTGIYEYIGEFPCKNNWSNDNCILKAIEFDKEICFFSRESCDAWIVNKEKKNFKHLKYYDGDLGGIGDIVQSDRYAVVLPYYANYPVLIVDLCDYIVKPLKWEEKLKENKLAFVRGININGCIYSATRTLDNVDVFKVSTSSKMITSYKVNLRMINAIGFRDGLWGLGLSRENKTVIQKIDDGIYGSEEHYVIEDIEPVLENGCIKYFRMYLHEKKVILIPSLAEKIYVYDMQNQQGYFLEYPEEIELKRINRKITFVEAQRVKDEIFLFPFGFDKIVKLDLRTYKITSTDISLEDNIAKGLLLNYMQLRNVINEDCIIDLEEFLGVL